MKYISILMILFTLSGFAQDGERIKAFKRAHITDALSLTSSEAEKFWPVYNAHEEKMSQLRKRERREVMQILKGDPSSMTEAQANDIIDKGIRLKETELSYNKELIENLRGVIPARKIVRLHKAEEEFKRILLERMKNRRQRRNK